MNYLFYHKSLSQILEKREVSLLPLHRHQVLVEKLKEVKDFLERVRDMQKKTKPFFDGLEQLSTVTKEEWLMLEQLMRLGVEVTKMNDDIQHLLASTVEPIPEEQINLNLPSSLHLEKNEKDEKDTQGPERGMKREKESFRTLFVRNQAHRRSSSSSVSVEPPEKHSQEETSSSSENSHSPHSNRGSKHE